MKYKVKLATRDGMPSSYKVIFENGLILSTVDLTFLTAVQKKEIKQQLDEAMPEDGIQC